MIIKEVLSRHRNDFSFTCGCEHCGHTFRRGDGYADHYFCTEVVPGQHCPECGLNSHGENAEQTAARYAAKEAEADD